MKWWDKYPSIEEVKLVAWHRMIKDSSMTVYTLDSGEINSSLVNPGLTILKEH